MLRRSLSDVGAARSIVIDEHDHILAGNGVIEAAADSGIKKLRVIEADGSTVIAVRRRGLSDEQKRRLAMYDNRTGELSTWNPAQLATDAAQGLDLKTFFSDAELSAMLKGTDEKAIRRFQVERPHEVVWVLVAVPLEVWPAHAAQVEALQQAGVFTTVAMRAKDDDDARKKENR